MENRVEFKETNIDWLGSIPSNWQLKPLKYICSLTTGNKDTINRDEEGIYPFFVRSKNIERINSYSYDGEAILTAGDGDICKIWHYINGKFDFHQRVYMLYDFNINTRYLYYYISENFFYDVYKLSAKSTVDSLRRPMFESFPVAVPPKETQIRIAEFLDKKTAKIDAIIEKKNNLLNLLEEKKKTIINEAVTKGINTNAPMKDSGIEWIGEIPEHWEVKKLKYLVDYIESGCSVNAEDSPIEKIDELGVLKTSCVYNYSFDDSENKKIFKEELNRVKCPVKRNTIIVSRMNTPELVGASGYVSKNYSNIYLPDRLWQLNFNNGYENIVEYISIILSSELYKRLYSRIATGSSPSMKNISKESYLDIDIILPPTEESLKILEYIQINVENLSILEIKLSTQIDKLKEYRHSLISEAVSGKIDI